MRKGESIILASDFFSDNLLTTDEILEKEVAVFEEYKRDGFFYHNEGTGFLSGREIEEKIKTGTMRPNTRLYLERIP